MGGLFSLHQFHSNEMADRRLKILWLVYALAWGSVHLVLARKKPIPSPRTVDPNSRITNHENARPAEDTFWTFGQSVAIILLALPISSLGEGFLGE